MNLLDYLFAAFTRGNAAGCRQETDAAIEAAMKLEYRLAVMEAAIVKTQRTKQPIKLSLIGDRETDDKD